ncbi:multiprotein-bridging factor 1 [Cystobasidiomycetes sp. EMM_F5]
MSGSYVFSYVVDWDSKTVIGSKARATTKSASEKEVNAARRTGAAVETDRKSGVGNRSHADPNHQRIAAVDRKDDVAPPATVSPDVGKAMQKARLDLGLTQKDLAGKTNEKPTVIGDYEAGRAIPAAQVLAKFERILKVKLRGKDIGSPFLTPSEKKAQEAGQKASAAK